MNHRRIEIYEIKIFDLGIFFWETESKDKSQGESEGEGKGEVSLTWLFS